MMGDDCGRFRVMIKVAISDLMGRYGAALRLLLMDQMMGI